MFNESKRGRMKMTERERERDSERVKRSYQLFFTDRLIKRNPDYVCESVWMCLCVLLLDFFGNLKRGQRIYFRWLYQPGLGADKINESVQWITTTLSTWRDATWDVLCVRFSICNFMHTTRKTRQTDGRTDKQKASKSQDESSLLWIYFEHTEKI